MKKIFAIIALAFCGSFLFAQQPCTFKYGATEEDSIACRQQIFYFSEFYKNKSYKDAYDNWQYLIQKAPCAYDGIYSNAQTLFQNLIKDEKDSARRELLLDSLLYAYDVRSTYFPDKFTPGSGLGYKAYNLMRYRKHLYEQAFDWFVQSVEMEKENTQAAIWDAYFQLAKNKTDATHDTSYVIEAYERATDYLDISVVNATKAYETSADALAELQMKFDSAEIDRIEFDKKAKKLIADTTRQSKLIAGFIKVKAKFEKAVAPYASCEVMEELYTKKFDDIKNDLQAVSKMVNTMFKAGCIKSPVFQEALSILHKNKPNRNTAYYMGNLTFQDYIKDKNAEDLNATIEYFKEAARLSETHEQQADAYYMLALAYREKNAYSESRSAAYDALKAKPNLGKAYILIGDLYANSGGRCGDEQVPGAYAWAAADKYSKAAAVDPSCANDANTKRARLRFPSSDELFKRGISKGSPYHVGCWIQENTTVK